MSTAVDYGTMNRPAIKLRDYQQQAHDNVFAEFDKRVKSTLVVHATGCHDADQPILMFDGTIKRAEDVLVGDVLMGPDSRGRNVLSLHRGTDDMFRIVPVKGEPFVVNGDHILTLAKTNVKKPTEPRPRGTVLAVDVSVRDWLKWHKTNKHRHKLFRVSARFPAGDRLELAPYFAGLLLGDGSLNAGSVSITTADWEVEEYCHAIARKYHINVRSGGPDGVAASHLFFTAEGCTRGRNDLKNAVRKAGLIGMRCENKYIPHAFKVASPVARLKLLAGLIDSDGHHHMGHYDFISKSKRLSDDVAFVARSLGMAAYVKPCEKRDQNGNGGTYYRVSISGNTDIVPCLIPRKVAPPRRQIKDHRKTGFSVEPVGRGDYFGFSVDGDHRYLMGDFTVTHNCGKTIVFGSIAKRVIEELGGRVLILAHRGELLKQAADSLAALGVDSAIEKAEQNAQATLFDDPMCVIGSVQTMQRRRLASWSPKHFKLVIVDESHHSTSVSYKAILKHLDPDWTLGVTATADRLDGENLGQVYQTVAHEYTIEDGIRSGYLSPLKIVRCETGIDLSKVRTTAGDMNEADLAAAIKPHVQKLANGIFQEIGNRRTLVFTPDVGSADAFASALRSLGLKAESVSGASKDRDEIIDGYKKGRIRVLCSCQLLTEGFDAPGTTAVVLLRPTKSRALASQMIGRGTRLAPNKNECLVVDFSWVTQKHALVNPVELFGDIDLEVHKIAKRMIEDGETDDLMEAIERAREEKQERAKIQLKIEREQTVYRRISYEPFSVMNDVLGIKVKPESDAAIKNKLSDKQLNALKWFGVDAAENMSKRRASMMLNALFERKDQGLATMKQVALAIRLGMEPGAARKISKAEMTAYLDARINVPRR